MMNSKHDFSALQQLLSHHRKDVLAHGQQTDLNRFLQELHRRQRAKLLVPATPWAYTLQWFRHRLELVEHLFTGLRPALAYTGAGATFAAVAIAAFFSLSPQMKVNGSTGNDFVQISLHLPGGSNPTLGLPTAETALNFSEHKLGRAFGSATQFAVSTPRFVLMDTHAAYDSRAAF